jgi:hypothetical protein
VTALARSRVRWFLSGVCLTVLLAGVVLLLLPMDPPHAADSWAPEPSCGSVLVPNPVAASFPDDGQVSGDCAQGRADRREAVLEWMVVAGFGLVALGVTARRRPWLDRQRVPA